MEDESRDADAVLAHNRAAAAVWDAGGEHYDEISSGIADALRHAVQRLAPRPGDGVLDVATGTGWCARLAARTGAHVTGVDIAPELIRAPERRSAHLAPRIEYRVADAERLPFERASFDRVVSTFGVMFAADHASAARELARVCRPGGRLCLATWPPGGAVARFFALVAAHGGASAPAASPLQWDDPDYVGRLLGEDFELRFEHGVKQRLLRQRRRAVDRVPARLRSAARRARPPRRERTPRAAGRRGCLPSAVRGPGRAARATRIPAHDRHAPPRLTAARTA